MHRQHETRSRSSLARPMVLVAAAGLAMAVVAGCGDDDKKSAQEKYCEAGESLEASVTALVGLDLVAEGTDGLESAIADVEDDVNELRDSATDAAEDDVDALEQSVDDLDSALSDLGDEITSENATAAGTAVQAVGAAAQGVYATLSDCP